MSQAMPLTLEIAEKYTLGLEDMSEPVDAASDTSRGDLEFSLLESLTPGAAAALASHRGKPQIKLTQVSDGLGRALARRIPEHHLFLSHNRRVFESSGSWDGYTWTRKP